MTGSVMIGGKRVELAATLGAMIRYKEQFGREYNDDIAALDKLKGDEDKYTTETALVGIKLIWAMAKTADNSIPSPEVWAEIFSEKDIVPIMIEAIALFSASLGDRTGEQERDGNDESFRTEELVALCTQYGISIGELDKLSINMILNIMEAVAEIRKCR